MNQPKNAADEIGQIGYNARVSAVQGTLFTD
jgi:hypothetical protein